MAAAQVPLASLIGSMSATELMFTAQPSILGASAIPGAMRRGAWCAEVEMLNICWGPEATAPPLISPQGRRGGSPRYRLCHLIAGVCGGGGGGQGVLPGRGPACLSSSLGGLLRGRAALSPAKTPPACLPTLLIPWPANDKSWPSAFSNKAQLLIAPANPLLSLTRVPGPSIDPFQHHASPSTSPCAQVECLWGRNKHHL